MRVVSTTAGKGGDALVSIELDPKGDEVATSFSLKFDPTKLKLDTTSGTNNPDITTGAGAPNGTGLMINADEAETGNLGIVVFNGGLTPFTKDGAAKQVVTIRFHVARDASEGETAIEFDGSQSAPTPTSTADAAANDLTASYQNGTVTITGQTSPTAEVSGRILTPDGHGLRNAKVTITDENGTTRTATTSSFGFYRFDSVVIGRTYIITVSSKRYRYSPRTIAITDNIADVDFVGLE